MNTYDFVHLTLHALGGSIQGRTKLQKVVYFLGVLTDSLPELGYSPHYYGPYSAEVAGALDRLRSIGFLEQIVASGGSVDASGFEVARYDYQLTDAGKLIAEAKAGMHAEEWRKLKAAAEVLSRAGEQDYVKLSLAAKTFFMLGERKRPATIRDLVQRASTFGWAVNPSQIDEAIQLLRSLQLVETNSP